MRWELGYRMILYAIKLNVSVAIQLGWHDFNALGRLLDENCFVGLGSPPSHSSDLEPRESYNNGCSGDAANDATHDSTRVRMGTVR